MKKMSCNVIQDLLEIYSDGAASEDTKRIVEEHLQECEVCRKICRELEADRDRSKMLPRENKEVKELRSFKRFLMRKKIRTICLSVLFSVILLLGVIVYMNNHMIRIDYKDTNIELYDEDEDIVYYKTGIKGNYHWNCEVDQETGEAEVYFEQSQWEKYVACVFYPFDHVHSILKKDMIKEIYVDSDGTETTIWEASEKEKKDYFAQEKNHPLG